MTSFREKRTKGSNDDFMIEGVYKTTVEEQTLYKDFCFRSGEIFQVYIRRDTLRAIYEHVLQGLRENREVAGILIGKFLIDNDKNVEFVEIVHALSVQAGDSTNIDVNIPAQEWTRVFELVKTSAKYRGEYTIIGWYHSHPNMKAFMSSVDQDTQAKHFSNKGQMAIVVGLGRGIQEVKCFNPESVECPLYFLPEENDTHLSVASLNQVQGMVKKEVYDGYETIQDLIVEVQRLRVEVENLKNIQNLRVDENLKTQIENDQNSIERENEITKYWLWLFSQIFSEFTQNEKVVENVGKYRLYLFYPELALRVGFHYGEQNVISTTTLLDKNINILSVDMSQIDKEKILGSIDDIRKVISKLRRNEGLLSSVLGFSINRKLVKAQEKCSRLQFLIQKNEDTV